MDIQEKVADNVNTYNPDTDTDKTVANGIITDATNMYIQLYTKLLPPYIKHLNEAIQRETFTEFNDSAVVPEWSEIRTLNHKL